MRRAGRRLLALVSSMGLMCACSSGGHPSSALGVPDARGNIASGTVSGRPWSAFLHQENGDAVVEFDVQGTDAGSVGNEVVPIDVTHSPGNHGMLALNIDSNHDSVRPDTTWIAGSVVRGQARTIRGQVGGRSFEAAVVDPGSGYPFDVFATALPGLTAMGSFQAWKAAAFDAKGQQVATYVAP